MLDTTKTWVISVGQFIVFFALVNGNRGVGGISNVEWACFSANSAHNNSK